MFYHQRPKIIHSKPLAEREPWWWERAAKKGRQTIIYLYELSLAFMLMVFVNFFKKETYVGQFASQCSFSTDELRAQCLMQEGAKLLAVFAAPAAKVHRDRTLALYQEEIRLLQRKVSGPVSSALRWLFPRSLYAHDCLLTEKKIAFMQSLVKDLRNTPRARLETRLKELDARIDESEKERVVVLFLKHSRDSEASSKARSDVAERYLDQKIEVIDREVQELRLQRNKVVEDLLTDTDEKIPLEKRYSYRMERAFSENIDAWYYDDKLRSNHLSEMQFLLQDKRDLLAHDGKVWKEKAQNLVHPDLKKWLTRKLSFCYRGSELEGNIHLIMWFHPLKFGFMYYTNTNRTIDTRILQAAAARYVLTYRCVDFFVDDVYFSFFTQTVHPEIRKYLLQEERQFQKKKRVRQPNGEFVWMIEDEWIDGLLQRQGYKDPSKWKLLQYFEDSEIKELATTTTYNEDGVLVALSAEPCSQEEIDEEYMKSCSIIERPPENPNSIAKTGKRIRELQELHPEFSQELRLRFERAVQDEDLPRELLPKVSNAHIPYFTNDEFETYAILYHGPESEHPINRTGKLLTQTDPVLCGLSNSQKMIEFCYEDASSSTIQRIGMERLEQAKTEAKQLCLTTGQEEDDYGRFVRRIRFDENAKTNSQSIEKLRITYEVNEMIERGVDTTELLLEMDSLPPTSSLQELQLLTDRSNVTLLLENGRDSNFLEVNGYYHMQSEEKKRALETRLVAMRRECITKRLNDVANKSYFCEQIQKNNSMMQSGRHIDKKKEALRFARHDDSNTFTSAPMAQLTYSEYIEMAKDTMDERRRIMFGIKDKKEDADDDEEGDEADDDEEEDESNEEEGDEADDDEEEDESDEEEIVS